MSKVKTGMTEAPAAAPATSTALARRGGPTEEQLAALKAAGIDIADTAGKEVIDGGDIVPPFVAMAQKTSGQIDPSDAAKYIEGLKFGDMFNSLTGDIYGTGPIRFVVLAIKKHAIEFTPWDQGGGIVDRNVPWNDERCEWGGADKSEEPIATRFYDFVVALQPGNELAIISCKVTSLRAGKTLCTIIGGNKFPMYMQQYEASTVVKKSGNNSYAVFVFQPAGLVTDVAQVQELKALAEKVASTRVVIEHEAEPPVDAAASADAVDGDKIPF